MGVIRANSPRTHVLSCKIQAVKLATVAFGGAFPANKKTHTDPVSVLVCIVHNLGLARRFPIKSAFTKGKVSWQSLRMKKKY